jgi:hypothetical protein
VSQEPNSEDLTILAAFENLERGADPSAVGGERGDETAETLARLYTEVLGLIPSELEPVAPSAGSRQRLLAAIGADPGPRSTDSRPIPVTAPAAPAAPAAPTAITETIRPRVPPGPLPRRQSRWPLALAAVLALAFAGTSVWLWLAQQGQRAETAQLRQELEAQRRLAAQASRDAQEGEQARTEMEKMRDQFALVTSPAVEILPLRPVGDRQLNARGLLFVAPDHQHWYLSLEGLPPPAPGEVYKLWWMTEQGPLDAGSLVAQSGEKIQMSSDRMPSGLREVVVTLEPSGSSPTPTGPRVLQAAT